jgi:alkaline phosphatase D
MHRREFVSRLSAFGLAVAGIPRLPIWLRPRFAANPFTLGIASGDPLADGIVLWTRLAPDPLNGGGMPNEAVRVRWEVASDEGMTRIVKRGTVDARPDLAHSVHAEVNGLGPARWYWYRFDAGGEASPVGRTRTAPAAGATPQQLRFAFASCQHYESGLYTAYQHMAAEDLELVAHLGDYIYEYNSPSSSNVPRRHELASATSLALYRNRYARYKSDADLQAAHRNFPWIVTWDDHEVENNYADDHSQVDSIPPSRFLERRAAAYQAYYEHMPLRKASIPRGPDMLLYRSLAFGSLARFHVLDTRQYRSNQACGDGNKLPCDEYRDHSRTIMGDQQERWLTREIERSSAAWTVLAQQVTFSEVFNPAQRDLVYMDAWSGYPDSRDRLASYMASRGDRNFIILTGDIHSNFVMNAPARFRDPSSPTVATEYVGTSISSGGDGRDRNPALANYENDIPYMKYHDARRGYVRCTVTPTEWRADYRRVEYVTRPGSPVTTAASFVTVKGKPGAEKV